MNRQECFEIYKEIYPYGKLSKDEVCEWVGRILTVDSFSPWRLKQLIQEGYEMTDDEFIRSNNFKENKR